MIVPLVSAVGNAILCILTPLMYVASHVKQAEAIGCFNGYSKVKQPNGGAAACIASGSNYDQI